MRHDRGLQSASLVFKLISEHSILLLHSGTYVLPAKGFPKCHMTQPKMLLRFKFIGICHFSNIVCLFTGHRDRYGEHRMQLALGDAGLVMASMEEGSGCIHHDLEGHRKFGNEKITLWGS